MMLGTLEKWKRSGVMSAQYVSWKICLQKRLKAWLDSFFQHPSPLTFQMELYSPLVTILIHFDEPIQ